MESPSLRNSSSDPISTTPWHDPLEHATFLASENTEPLVLLYSGLANADGSRQSWLASGCAGIVQGGWSDLANHWLEGSDSDGPDWFGYLGYELNGELEPRLPVASPSVLEFPRLWMSRFNHRWHYDHVGQQITGPATQLQFPTISPHDDAPQIAEFSSNMSRDEYLRKVEATLEAIRAGEFYQANITRKFYGRFSRKPDAFALFRRMASVSPSPYSAFIRLDGRRSILSSSPELFLKIDESGHVEARPIKGTIARHPDPLQDQLQISQLQNSLKDHAENLMIVDLMRHDLARSCLAGSVRVPQLFRLDSYATVHHLSSIIEGQRKPDASSVDVIQHCFPPGSMTGAPKIRAMQWCAEQEKMERGAYSGAIGWLGGRGTAHLSVVIRTLLLEDDRFEFQVGGGIVADSDPEQEWQETLWKARGICRTLNISESYLREFDGFTLPDS